MSKPTDIRVEHAQVSFHDQRFASPFQLSRGQITAITYAVAKIYAVTRGGAHTIGTGAILLSDLWAFPSLELDHTQKARLMRQVCEKIAALLPSVECADPMQISFALAQELPNIASVVQLENSLPAGVAIPTLALLNSMAPFDAAIHDAWGRALGQPAYECYSKDFLDSDLSAYLGADFAGCYPSQKFRTRHCHLLVQHVVGLSDALTPSEANSTDPRDVERPNNLQSWIRRERVFIFKVKSAGRNPAEDARRLADVYRVAHETLAEFGTETQPRLSCDPNEGYHDVDGLVELLDRLEKDYPAVFTALDYLEQPTPRDLYHAALSRASKRKPIIMDESLDRLDHLHLLQSLGWSGLAVKTAKGHTHSILAYCWAARHNLYVAIQDLTNPGRALVHSANLASYLRLTKDYLECNGRQYIPDATPEEQAAYPDYFRIVDGAIKLPARSGPGLY